MRPRRNGLPGQSSGVRSERSYANPPAAALFPVKPCANWSLRGSACAWYAHCWRSVLAVAGTASAQEGRHQADRHSVTDLTSNPAGQKE